MANMMDELVPRKLQTQEWIKRQSFASFSKSYNLHRNMIPTDDQWLESEEGINAQLQKVAVDHVRESGRKRKRVDVATNDPDDEDVDTELQRKVLIADARVVSRQWLRQQEKHDEQEEPWEKLGSSMSLPLLTRWVKSIASFTKLMTSMA